MGNACGKENEDYLCGWMTFHCFLDAFLMETTTEHLAHDNSGYNLEFVAFWSK